MYVYVQADAETMRRALYEAQWPKTAVVKRAEEEAEEEEGEGRRDEISSGRRDERARQREISAPIHRRRSWR